MGLPEFYHLCRKVSIFFLTDNPPQIFHTFLLLGFSNVAWKWNYVPCIYIAWVVLLNQFIYNINFGYFSGRNFIRCKKRTTFAWWKYFREVLNGKLYCVWQNGDFDSWQTCCYKGCDSQVCEKQRFWDWVGRKFSFLLLFASKHIFFYKRTREISL